MKTVSTGIEILDRKLGGGIPAGSIVALVAKPASQAELVLLELTAEHETLYLTTQRSAQAVRDAIDRTSTRVGEPVVQEVEAEAPIDHALALIRQLPEGVNLIVDSVDVLEADGGVRYRNFLNDLQTHMVNIGGVAYLHCLDGRAVSPMRDTTEYMADLVFTLSTDVKGETIENRLTIPKYRGGAAIRDAIKLQLADRVAIDTSRDIA
ncbi:transcriptional regulator [Haladaptatus sp. DYSN1]|uniref:RAD55 family ATPase n=1 Tax=unclassified Haladaptatus TaxID=2622732 RepID=UPI002405D1F2|nr:transcriptional regulator [Haladaptatus sp. DYSN1]